MSRQVCLRLSLSLSLSLSLPPSLSPTLTGEKGASGAKEKKRTKQKLI